MFAVKRCVFRGLAKVVQQHQQHALKLYELIFCSISRGSFTMQF